MDGCYCLPGNEVTLRMVDIAKCNTTCSGDVRDGCGGIGVMSVYNEGKRISDFNILKVNKIDLSFAPIFQFDFGAFNFKQDIKLSTWRL